MTTTQLGRTKLVIWPDLNDPVGATQVDRIQDSIEVLSDNASSRIASFATIADSTTSAIDHNLGANIDQLDVLIYTGAGASKTLLLDTVAAGYVIAETGGSEKTSIDVTTPGAGGPHTFVVVIMDTALTPHVVQHLIAVAPAAPVASTLKTWWDSNKRGLSIDSAGFVSTTQTLAPFHVSSSFNAVPGRHYIVDTSGGVVTGTMPATIQDYDVIQFSDAKKTFNANNFTIGRNTNDIDSETEDLVLTADGDGALLVGDNTASNWVRSGGGGGAGGLEVLFQTTNFTAEAGFHYYCADTVTAIQMPQITGDEQIAVSPARGALWSAIGITVTPFSGEQIDGELADETKILNLSGVDKVTFTGDLASTNWEFNTPITPTTIGNGAIVGGWTSFTPTGSWTSNATYTGFYRQVGESMEITAKVEMSGAPNVTDLAFDMPTGFTIDTAKLPPRDSTFDVVLGSAIIQDAGVRTYTGSTALGSSTTVWVVHSESTNVGVVRNNSPFAFAATDSVTISFTVPVLEFANSGTTLTASDFSAKTQWVDLTVAGGLGISSPTANTTIDAANFISTRDSNGVYWLEGRVAVTHNTSSINVIRVDFDDYTFSTFATAQDMAISGQGQGSLSQRSEHASAFANGNGVAGAGQIAMRWTTSYVITDADWYFKARLDSKPSWFDANAESNFNLDIHFQEATATTLGLVKASDGTYVPTLTNVSQTSALGAPFPIQFLIVGNSVQVSGVVEVTNTAGGTKRFRISLPPDATSNIAGETSIQGMVNCTDTSLAGVIARGIVKGDPANNEIEVYYETADTSPRLLMFTASYRIV